MSLYLEQNEELERWEIVNTIGEPLVIIEGTLNSPSIKLVGTYKYFDLVTHGSNLGCVVVNDYIGKVYPEEYTSFENEQREIFEISKLIINSMDILFS